MQKPLKIQELILKEEKNPRSFCESFIYEPSNYEEEKFGTLILVGEALNFHPDAGYLLNYFASLLKREYYSDFRKEPSAALEAALKKANAISEQIKQRENIDVAPKLKFLAAAIAGERLYLSQMGKIFALILRSGQIFDLSRKIVQLAGKPTIGFSHILRGQVYAGDRIVFVTENFFKLCSLREFKQILENETLESANQNIEIVLRGREYLNLAAAFAESLTGPPAPKQKIIQKKRKTGALTLEEIFGRKEAKTPTVQKITFFEETPLNGKEPDKLFKKEIGVHLPPTAGRITLIAAKIAGRLRFHVVRPPIQNLISKARIFSAPRELKNRLTRRKIYLGVSLIFAVLLMVFSLKSVFWQRKIIEIGNLDNLITQAQKKIEAADSALIIRDKNLALKNLAEAQSLVGDVLKLSLSDGRADLRKTTDEAVKLATEIRQKIIKLQAKKK